MGEFNRRLHERAEKILEPYRYARGDNAAEVRVALLILQAADEIDAELYERRITTEQAVEETGWAAETLQKWARATLAGGPVPEAWEDLRVEKAGSGYLFTLSTIPANPRAVAA